MTTQTTVQLRIYFYICFYTGMRATDFAIKQELRYVTQAIPILMQYVLNTRKMYIHALNTHFKHTFKNNVNRNPGRFYTDLNLIWPELSNHSIRIYARQSRFSASQRVDRLSQRTLDTGYPFNNGTVSLTDDSVPVSLHLLWMEVQQIRS